MIVKYLVDEKYIPNDGSKKIIENFEKKIKSKDCETLIYPDVHYKKGSRVVNGMLFSSSKYILPACLGVENCGFSVALIKNDISNEHIYDSFERYTRKFKCHKRVSRQSIIKLLGKYIEKDFINKRELYNFLGFSSLDSLLKKSEECITDDLFKMAELSLGVLGGGNHFLEVHEIVESDTDTIEKGSKICILHSDSIAVGDYINLMFSNLSELDYFGNTIENMYRRLSLRLKQIRFFIKEGIKIWDIPELFLLLYFQKDYRLLKKNTKISKLLLFYHNLASVFGDINRDIIISEWANIANVEFELLFSHPHDNISIEKYDGQELVVQRNGVQKLKDDEFFIIPGAMGTHAYILKNPHNKMAFYSANHGTGRYADKHIAKTKFTKDETIKELDDNKVKLYKIGNGNLAEQNYKSFKDVDEIVGEMEKKQLGKMVAKTKPIAVVKG